MTRSGSFCTSLFALALGLLASESARADAKWIWFDEGDPLKEAPAGKVWLRAEIRASEPSTGVARVAADDGFALWVNGQKVGEGGGEKVFRFNLNGIVGRGVNVIAVEATNKAGPAGLYIHGEIRGQSGRAIAFDTGPDWKATRSAPADDAWKAPEFPEAGWKPARVLAAHADSPWKAIDFSESYLDRFTLAPGLELERIAEPGQVGSLVAMTWGNRGKLLVSRENGPVLVLHDDNGDGKFDQVTEYAREVKNCQGLCVVGDDLYAVGDGPKGAGMYRLPDRNKDDKADEVLHLVSYRGGIGEHGPHDVVLGPDGWLYHNLGNHAHVKATPEPTSPARHYDEGYLLEPKFEDALGHAVGIKAPGGTIWRFTPDAKKWWLETNGFRNHYDIAFSAAGDLFTFDSDMEWDVGQPWYRPVRVNHCTPGAEFGWRSGAAKWPAYYFDSLPAAIDVGRGSPCGVVFYEHSLLPEPFRGTLLLSDWSMGRVLAARLEPKGSSFGGSFEVLASGNPLNVSDIEVDRDGSVVFCVGGRNTEGGVYRIRPQGLATRIQPPMSTSLEEVLTSPQPSAAWAREAAASVKAAVGEKAWVEGLSAAVREGSPGRKIRALTLLAQQGPKPGRDLLLAAASDPDASVRAFAVWQLGDHDGEPVREALIRRLADESPVVRRRACEAFVRSGIEAPVDPVLALLSTPEDRFLRFAARLCLERIPPAKWKDKVLAAKEPLLKVEGLYALHRLGKEALTPQAALWNELGLLEELGSLDPESKIALPRMIQRTLLAGGKGFETGKIGERLLTVFPTGDGPFDMEAARILAYLKAPAANAKIVALLSADQPREMQIHAALCLRYLREGWDAGRRSALLDWFETTQRWEGGDSFVPYLNNIVGATVADFSPADRKALLEGWPKRPYAARMLLRHSNPQSIADYDAVLGGMLEEIGRQPSLDRGGEMTAAVIDALGKSLSDPAQDALRKLYETAPDHRDPIARTLAERPVPANRPILIRALESTDATTLQVCLNALGKIDQKPSGPGEYRAVLLAGLRSSGRPRALAIQLLDKWSGEDRLALYQNWFAKAFPGEPPVELAKSDPSKSKYAYDQLLSFLENDAKGKAGDVERGKQAFAKANCIKCHRFGNEGQGVGPDLTSVRRRFQRREILESILAPSKVVSDQYKSVTVATLDGLVHTGMPLPQADPSKLVLLLPNATKVEIPVGEVEGKQPTTTSVMPDGLLDPLSLEEIADLFALLETSKFNEPAPAAGAQAAAGR